MGLVHSLQVSPEEIRLEGHHADICSCACQNSASCASLAGLWNEVWILSSRALNAASTCRIACHILTALFQLRLVSNHHYTELSTILRDTLAIHGPSTCDEASISLICTVLDFAQTTRPAMFEDLARAAQSWLFRTWDPGMYPKLDHRAIANITQARPIQT